MDWDFAKTKTVLYFYEYLIRKGEPQKVGDLSCLFGEKDFTEDMRLIVRKSLAGLKKLLSENPCLFTIIDNELVYLKESASSVVTVERDVNDETKNYFTHKLLSYGVGAKVPIKSLHGHRSQALPHIRHTSGITTKDFKRFLSQYPETFQIDGKTVLLLGFDELEIVLKTGTSHAGLPIDDHKAVHKINNFHQAPQHHGNSLLECSQIRGNLIASTALKNLNLSFNAANGEPLGLGNIDSVSKGKLENLCGRNCPKLCEIANVFSPLQLCDGSGVSNQVKVRKNTQIIATVADSLLVTGEILKFIDDSGTQAIVSFNCKGTRIGEYTTMALLELGTPSGQAFLFDVLTCPQIMTDGGVKALLESDRVVKVIHNCRYKSGNLYEQFQILLRCVFDTQAANAILQSQKNGTQVKKVKSLSFHQLIQLYCPFNSVNEPFARCQWSVRERPFKEEMIIYAAREVLALMQLYGYMALLIKEENKTLLSVICTEEILAWIHPLEVKEQQTERNQTEHNNNSKDADLETRLGPSTKNIVMKSSEMTDPRSLTSELDCASHDGVTLQKTTDRRCCDCYVDKESQTLSTGHIVMKGIVCDTSKQFPQ